MTWTCNRCDPPIDFASYGKAEKHARTEHGGARISVNVETRKVR